MAKFYTPYDEKPPVKPSNPGNRMEPEYKERYDEKGEAYLEKVGEVDTYEKIQSYREECDVMAILSRYAAGDTSVMSNPGWYIDTTKLPKTYTDYINMMNEQREKFDALPLEIRKEFGMDFNKYMATAGNEEWLKIMNPKPIETEEKKDEQKQ